MYCFSIRGRSFWVKFVEGRNVDNDNNNTCKKTVGYEQLITINQSIIYLNQTNGPYTLENKYKIQKVQMEIEVKEN